MRDDREITAKPPDEYRVLVLGDSMVLAVQVAFEETFTARLEQHLNTNASHRFVRVINAGVQGYGPVESYLFLKHYGLAFEPDLVLRSCTPVTMRPTQPIRNTASLRQLGCARWGLARPRSGHAGGWARRFGCGGSAGGARRRSL